MIKKLFYGTVTIGFAVFAYGKGLYHGVDIYDGFIQPYINAIATETNKSVEEMCDLLHRPDVVTTCKDSVVHHIFNHIPFIGKKLLDIYEGGRRYEDGNVEND